MLELLSPGDGAKVLLVGEREGLLAGRLVRERGAAVTWLDPASHGGHAPQVTEIHPGGPGFRAMLADCGDTPFEAEEFDAVASQLTVEYLDDPARALAEWRRVMKPGGTLALVTRNALYGGGDPLPRPCPIRSFSPGELRRLVEDRGFSVRRLHTLIPDLRLPRVYRGDLSFSYRFERLPYFRDRGLLLFVSAVKTQERGTVGGQGGP
jgi:SAM-dependent methyltransferase